MQWTLAVRPAADEVLAVASGAYPKLGAHSLELWLITEAGPVSLGLLPTAGEGRLKLPAGVSGAQLTPGGVAGTGRRLADRPADRPGADLGPGAQGRLTRRQQQAETGDPLAGFFVSAGADR